MKRVCRSETKYSCSFPVNTVASVSTQTGYVIGNSRDRARNAYAHILTHRSCPKAHCLPVQSPCDLNNVAFTAHETRHSANETQNETQDSYYLPGCIAYIIIIVWLCPKTSTVCCSLGHFDLNQHELVSIR